MIHQQPSLNTICSNIKIHSHFHIKFITNCKKPSTRVANQIQKSHLKSFSKTFENFRKRSLLCNQTLHKYNNQQPFDLNHMLPCKWKELNIVPAWRVNYIVCLLSLWCTQSNEKSFLLSHVSPHPWWKFYVLQIIALLVLRMFAALCMASSISYH
jgi:hypothetical protein